MRADSGDEVSGLSIDIAPESREGAGSIHHCRVCWPDEDCEGEREGEVAAGPRPAASRCSLSSRMFPGEGTQVGMLDGANSVAAAAAAWESIKTGQVVEVPMIS